MSDGHEELLAKVSAAMERAEELRPLKRKAYNCRFLECYVETVARRQLELKREVGEFKRAINENHIKKVSDRLMILKQLSANIQAFSGQSSLDLDEEKHLDEIKKLISDFENRVLNVLKKGGDSGEAGAEAAIKKAHAACLKLTKAAFSHLQNALAEMENAICMDALAVSNPERELVSVVSLDLAQYGRHVESLDAYLEASGVWGLNEQIGNLIRKALETAGIRGEDVLRVDTGDGGIIVFRSDKNVSGSELAVRFAKAFYSSLGQWNTSKPPDYCLHFRIGISTGQVMLSKSSLRTGKSMSFKMGGVTIGKAVRLQSGAKTEEIVACAETYSALSDRKGFSDEVEIKGKTHEKRAIPARRFRSLEPFSEEQTGFVDKKN